MQDRPQDAAELRQRLREAEDTLRAIRDGEIDALLVRGDDQDRVFHLSGDSQSWRAFLEAMEIGAAALDEAGKLIYANATLLELVQRSEESLQADGLLPALGQPGAEQVSNLLAQQEGKGPRGVQILLTAGEQKRHIVVNAAPLPLGFATGHALTFTDITQRVDAAAAEESERIGRAIMASANEAVLVCDAAGVVTHASPAVLSILPASPVGQAFEAAIPLSFAPGAGAMFADDLLAIGMSGSSVRGIEAILAPPLPPKDLLISAAPLRKAGGAVGGCIITLIDLSERKALEKRQELLMRELGHRMKNTLALVLSICGRTLASVTDLADFRERFTQRVAALAATQDLLAERAWTSVSLADLVEVELAPYISPRSPRVRLSNLSVKVTRDAAVALGLVFHELVTNAVKYGALALEAGCITVTATRLGESGAVEILWREEGGPPVSPPKKPGFGQTVIARGLGNSAAAATRVCFYPEGVSCLMTLSRECLLAE